ncbi:hypothetical protein SCOR_16040 [Sulfidibacter corallicola]
MRNKLTRTLLWIWFCTGALAPVSAQSLFNARPCPSDAERLVLDSFQYYLAAEVALSGTLDWVKENPTKLDGYYGAAVGKRGDALGTAAKKAFDGLADSPKLRGFLLHPKWPGAASAAEKNWHAFLKAGDPATKLGLLRKVDFTKLNVLKNGDAPLEPWLYAVLKREAGYMVTKGFAKVPQGSPAHATLMVLDAMVRGKLDKSLAGSLGSLPLPDGLKSSYGIRDAAMKLLALSKLPEDAYSALVIKDAEGLQYALLKGEMPNAQRPRGASKDALLKWRKEVAVPFRQATDFWLGVMALRLFEMGEYPSAARLIAKQQDLEPGSKRCSHEPGNTVALLRYSADVLRPKGHFQERNFLQESGFNAHALLYQLEIEPTSGGVKF